MDNNKYIFKNIGKSIETNYRQKIKKTKIYILHLNLK